MKTKIYLSGAMKHQDKAFQTWRDMAATLLNEAAYGRVNIVDPSRDFGYDQWNLPPTDKACLSMYMHKIKKSDLVLVNLDSSEISVGTGIEIHHATMYNKPVIGFGSDANSWYGWTAEECDVIFETLEEAVEYICIHYID